MSVQLWEAAEEAERERAEACAALAQSRRWHREALDDYLRVLADRADGKAPLRIRVALEPDNLMPALGCCVGGPCYAAGMTRSRLDQESYHNGVTACALAARLLASHDLPALLQAIDRAETLGPFLDPTLYAQRGTAMREDAALLRAALPLVEFARKHLAVPQPPAPDPA